MLESEDDGYDQTMKFKEFISRFYQKRSEENKHCALIKRQKARNTMIKGDNEALSTKHTNTNAIMTMSLRQHSTHVKILIDELK